MGDFTDFTEEVRQAVDDELHRLVGIYGDGVYRIPASIMEIPAEFCCTACPFHSDDCMCVYVGKEFNGGRVLVYDRSSRCRAAFPNGAAIVIVPKAKE